MTLAEEADRRLFAELGAALDDTALTEAEYLDPEEFAAAVLNNLPAIAYALGAGMPVTKWQPAKRNVGEEQRVLRAVRQWGEAARRLIVAYVNGAMTYADFVGNLIAAYEQHARNSYVAGRRSVGDVVPLGPAAVDSLTGLTAADTQRLRDAFSTPQGQAAIGGGVGIGAILKSMFDPSAIFTPSNFLGSGLPGDPFAGLPPPLGAGGGHKKPHVAPKVPGAGTEPFETTEPIAGPAGKLVGDAAELEAEADRLTAQRAVGDYLNTVDNAGRVIGSYAQKGELDALTQAIPAEAVLSWWVLGESDHCIDCIRLSEAGPYYASMLAADGLYPRSGHTRCGDHCQCHIEHHVPAEICTDPMRGPGSLGGVPTPDPGDPTDLIEAADLRWNVWVMEADACRNPQSIDAWAASAGLTPSIDAQPYSWDSDVAQVITSDAPVTFTALPAEIRNAFGFLRDVIPGGNTEALQATRYTLDGTDYHALWQRAGGAIRFEAGTTTAGLGVLDPEFTLRAIHDLTAMAETEGLRFEVNSATANAGMMRWLDSLGAPHSGIVRPPSVKPAWEQLDPLATNSLPRAADIGYVGPLQPVDTMRAQMPEIGVGEKYNPSLGANPKALLADDHGQGWLVKYMADAGDATGPARAMPEIVATQVHELLGAVVAPVGLTSHNGRAGTLQKIIQQGETLMRSGRSIHELAAADQRELMRQAVTDRLVGNVDAHYGNFLLTPDGLVGIDKGLAFWNLPRVADIPMAENKIAVAAQWGDKVATDIWRNVSPSDVDAILTRIETWSTDSYMAFVEKVIPGLRAGGQKGVSSATWRRLIRERKDNLRADVADFFDTMARRTDPDSLTAEWRSFLERHDFGPPPLAGIAPDLAAAPIFPDISLLTGGKTGLGGKVKKEVYRDADGQKWMFKRGTGTMAGTIPVEAGARAEAASYRIGRAIGADVVPVTAMQDATGLWGSLQPLVPTKFLPESVTGLTDAQTVALAQGHALDRLLGNFDASAQNWLLAADGTLLPLDKGYGLIGVIFAGSSGHLDSTALDFGYWSELFRQPGMLTRVHPADIERVLGPIVHMTDAEYLDLIGPDTIAALAKGKYGYATKVKVTPDQITGWLLERKHSVLADEQGWWKKGLTEYRHGEIPPEWQAWLDKGATFEPADIAPKMGIAPEQMPLPVNPPILPATILPTPSLVLAEVDALPAWPSMGRLKPTPGAKALGGANPKKLLADPDGREWLFKAGGTAERSEGDVAAAELARQMGLRVPPVQQVTWDGVEGTLQPILADAKALDRIMDKGQIAAEVLDEQGVREVARQSVLDFVLANNDTHGGNFVLSGGQVWGIDKGRSYVGGVIASMNPAGFFNPTGGMGTVMGGALRFPERSHVWTRLRPADMAEVFNRLDGISAEEFGRISGPVLPHIANPFGTPEQSLEVLLQRKGAARARYEQWFREAIAEAPDGEVSPEWRSWAKAGGTFDVAPVAAAGEPVRVLPAPADAAPMPKEMRSSATYESRVGNDLGVLPAGFVPATDMTTALSRLSKALPKTSGNVTGGFSLGQINAIVARAETMGDMGVDMGMLRRLGDFTLVPKADQSLGIGLTYKGDRIALNHDFRWKFLGGVDSPDTVYNDIGGLFAHEYGHVAFAHLGSEQQAKVIALYKAHAGKAAADLSTYAAADVEEWAGEVMAAITTPGYKPGTLAYDEEFWTSLTADGSAKAVTKADKVPALLKEPKVPPAPIPTSPIGPPVKAPAEAWFKPHDAQQYLIPDNPLPINAPHAQWSGHVPAEPGVPSVASTKEAVAAARKAHDDAMRDWHDVIDGKVKVAFTWDKAGSAAAEKAGLTVEKIGGAYVTAHGPTDLEPLKAYIAGGGKSDDDAFWKMLGYSDADLAAYDAYYSAKKGLRLTAGVVMVEPDGRMWVLAPKNKYAGYENTWMKGGVDEGETTAQAAVREVMEEGGFSVELDSYLGDYVNTDKTGIARMYIGHRSGGGPLWAHADETYQVRLVDPADATDMLLRYDKPDERDQKILADAVVALQGGPGIEQIVIPAGDVPELAAKTAPAPNTWWPSAKTSSYKASDLSPKAAIAPEPPLSQAFGYDQNVWKTFTPTELPPATKFPYSTTRWTLASGETQKMFWQTPPGELFWANSKNQLADPHMRLSLHVAQINRMAEIMAADPSLLTMRVNAALLDNVPGLRDLLVAAGGTGTDKFLTIGSADVQKLSAAIKGNTGLGKAGLAGTVPTAAMSPIPAATGAFGLSPDTIGSVMGTGIYLGDPSIAQGAFNVIEFDHGTQIGWQVDQSLANGQPLYHVSGPGKGYVTDSERDALLVTAAAHMSAVMTAIGDPGAEVIFNRNTWGDIDEIADKLGLQHPFHSVWKATPDQLANIAATTKSELAAVNYAPDLLGFSLSEAAVPPPTLHGLYKSGAITRAAHLPEAADYIDYTSMGMVSYNHGGTKIGWKFQTHPASPMDEMFVFTKVGTKGPNPLDDVLTMIARMGPDAEEGSSTALAFSRDVTGKAPGLTEILKAWGAQPVPGSPSTLWIDEQHSHDMVLALWHGDATAPGTIIPGVQIPITGSPTAAAVAAIVTPTSAPLTIDALVGLVEKKETIGGIPLTRADLANGGAFTWRRLGNDLELHVTAGPPEVLTAAIIRLGKFADENVKVANLRVKAGVLLSPDEAAMLKAAGAKVAASGTTSLTREQLLALRDQMVEDLKAAAAVVSPAVPAAVILPALGIDPAEASALKGTLVPQKQGFEKVEWAHDSWAAPVAIRQRNLSDTIVWSNVSGGTEPQRMTAGVRHLTRIADQMDGNAKLTQIRFENLDQMGPAFHALLSEHGLYEVGTVSYLPRQQVLDLRALMEPEMGHGVVTQATTAIAAPPVTSFVEGIGVDPAAVTAMLAAPKAFGAQTGNTILRTWPGGIEARYGLQPDGSIRLGSVVIGGTGTAGTAERRAAVVAQIRDLATAVENKVIPHLEIGPSVFVGVWGQQMKDQMLIAGATEMGPDLILIDLDVAKKITAAVDGNTPLGVAASASGVPFAPPTITAGSLSEQLGYNYGDLQSVQTLFSSDDWTGTIGALNYSLPGSHYGFFASFTPATGVPNAIELDIATNPVFSAEQTTVGVFHLMAEADHALQSGESAAKFVHLKAEHMPQPVHDFFAAQGWGYDASDPNAFYSMSKADLHELVGFIDADTATGKVVAGSAALPAPVAAPKDPFAIVGLPSDPLPVKGAYTIDKTGAIEIATYPGVDMQYVLKSGMPVALWLKADVTAYTGQNASALAFLHDFHDAAKAEGMDWLVVGQAVHANPSLQIGHLLTEYGAEVDGTTLKISMEKLDALVDDMDAAVGPNFVIPSPPPLPVASPHVPAWPTQYGFSKNALEAFPALTVTPQAQGFVALEWPGIAKARYRASSTTLTLATMDKSAVAPEAFVATIRHFADVMDAQPGVKQARFALDQIPGGGSGQMALMLTNEGKATLTLDGKFWVVESGDLKALRDTLNADLSGVGGLPAAAASAQATGALKVGDKVKITNALHGDEMTITGITPDGKLHLAYSDGATASPPGGLSPSLVTPVGAAPGPLAVGDTLVSSSGSTVTVKAIKPNGDIEVEHVTGAIGTGNVATMSGSGWTKGGVPLDQLPSSAPAVAAIVPGPNGDTVGLAVGDVLKNPAGKNFTVTDVQPNGMFSLVAHDGTMLDDLLPGTTSLKKAAVAAPVPPAPDHLWAKYNVDEPSLAQYEAGNTGWAPYQKNYSTSYKDASITPPMHPSYGYPMSTVIGAPSPLVRISGKKHVARWTIDEVTYGTDAQQLAALYHHLHLMTKASAGQVPIFVSEHVLVAHPELRRLLLGAGADEKMFANYGLGLDLDKKAVAALAQKMDAAPMPGTIGHAVAAGPNASTAGATAAASTHVPGTPIGINDVIATGNTLLSPSSIPWTVEDTSGVFVSLSHPSMGTKTKTKAELLNEGWYHGTPGPAGTASSIPVPTPTAASVAAVAPPPVPVASIPTGPIGSAVSTPAGGTIAGPKVAPAGPTPSFLYGYDPTIVSTASGVDLGEIQYGTGATAGPKKIMAIGQVKAYWSVAPKGDRVGLFALDVPAGATASEARDAAFAMLRQIAEHGVSTPKGFFLMPEFYNKVEGIKQLLLDAGGIEKQWPALGEAVAMEPAAAQKLIDALRTDTMGPIKTGFQSTSQFLSFDAAGAQALFVASPKKIDAKTGVFTWKTATGSPEVTVNASAGFGRATIAAVKGDAVTTPLAVVAQLHWLADQGATEILVTKAVIEAVPTLRPWLLTIGGHVDGGVIRLDDQAVANAARHLAKDALPAGLGGKALPYSVFDEMRTSTQEVTKAIGNHTVKGTGAVSISTFDIGGTPVTTRWMRSGTNVLWESIDRGKASVGTTRAAAAAQLRAFATTVAQDVGIERLDIAMSVLTAQPALRTVLLKYGAQELPASGGREAFLSLPRSQALKMRKDIEGEFDQIGTGGSFIQQQAVQIVWPIADELKYDVAGTAKLSGQTLKGLYKDAAGDAWLFKPGRGTGYGPITDAATAELARLLGLPVPPVRTYTVVFNGHEVEGSLQKMLPGAKSINKVEELTPAQTEDMLRHSVMDWVTNNDDAHVGNWIVGPDGHLWAIDKSRSWTTLDTATDRLFNANNGNGFKPLIFDFFTKARADPSLLTKIHPQTLAPTLRALRDIDDKAFRGMVKGVADATFVDRWKGKTDQLLDKMVARKQSAAGDFETYLKGEIDAAVKLHPASVPAEWKAWAAAGGKINLDQTPEMLWREDWAALRSKFNPTGTWSPAAYQAAVATVSNKATGVIRQFVGSGLAHHQGEAVLKGASPLGQYAANYIPLLIPPKEYEEWQDLQRWAMYEILNGGTPILNSSLVAEYRKMWNPATGTLRLVRGEGTGYASGAKTGYAKWQQEGSRAAFSSSHVRPPWGQYFFYFEIPLTQVVSSQFTDISNSGEREILVRNIRADQIYAVVNRQLSAAEQLNYSGPVMAP